jgi:hypothetical protein
VVARPTLEAASQPATVAAVKPPSAAASAASAAGAAAAVATQPAAASGPTSFALSTRRLRTRAESEQTLAAMHALLLTSGVSRVKVEIVPAGDDWRVISWPFPQREQADRARALLAARGMRLEVIDF